jgi:hypothetical protein
MKVKKIFESSEVKTIEKITKQIGELEAKLENAKKNYKKREQHNEKKYGYTSAEKQNIDVIQKQIDELKSKKSEISQSIK